VTRRCERGSILLRIHQARNRLAFLSIARARDIVTESEIESIFSACPFLFVDLVRFGAILNSASHRINVSSESRSNAFASPRASSYASRLPILFLARSSTRGWPQHVLRNLRNALNGNAEFFRVPLRFYLATTCAITPCDSSISMTVGDKDTMEIDFRFTQTAAARAR